MRRKLKRICLDGRRMGSRESAHAYLKERLALPEHYGENLDALADCLGELTGVSVTLCHARALREGLGEYAETLLRVLRDAARGREDLRFRVRGGCLGPGRQG